MEKQPSNSVADQYDLYMLLCDAEIIYTGISVDVDRRLTEHKTGRPVGAKFTSRFKELKLVYKTTIGSRSEALKVEIMVKKLKRSKKMTIINQQFNQQELFSYLL